MGVGIIFIDMPNLLFVGCVCELDEVVAFQFEVMLLLVYLITPFHEQSIRYRWQLTSDSPNDALHSLLSLLFTRLLEYEEGVSHEIDEFDSVLIED
jgi:hypothetical protein